MRLRAVGDSIMGIEMAVDKQGEWIVGVPACASVRVRSIQTISAENPNGSTDHMDVTGDTQCVRFLGDRSC